MTKEDPAPANPGAFRVGPCHMGMGSWWVFSQMPHYNPPGTRLPTQEEAGIMERIEWSTDRPGDVERLMESIHAAPPTEHAGHE